MGIGQKSEKQLNSRFLLSVWYFLLEFGRLLRPKTVGSLLSMAVKGR
jgi:hypothetical protein